MASVADEDIGDAAWAEIAPLLPSERGRQARPAQDNRRYLNGMLFVLQTGCPWRRMPARYGKWNSIYVRLQRWREQGVWDGVEAALARRGLTGDRTLPRRGFGCGRASLDQVQLRL